jgi:hypothetical protein
LDKVQKKTVDNDVELSNFAQIVAIKELLLEKGIITIDELHAKKQEVIKKHKLD